MYIPGEDIHSLRVKFLFPVRHIPISSDAQPHSQCIPGEAHPHFPGGCASCESHRHFQWGCFTPLFPHRECTSSLAMEHVPHQQCTSSPGIGMYLTRNAHPHQEWGYASPAMHILTRNAYPHQECISSPGIHMVYTLCYIGKIRIYSFSFSDHFPRTSV